MFRALLDNTMIDAIEAHLKLFAETLHIMISKNVGAYSNTEEIYGKIEKALE